MIAFVHGPDSLLVREAIRELCFEIDPTGVNTTRIDGHSTSPEQIAVMVGTPAFLGMGRLIIVDDLFTGKRAPRNQAESRERAAAPSKQSLALFSAVADGNSLIFSEPGIEKIPSAIAKAAPGLLVRAGNPPRGSALVQWVHKQATIAGSTIDNKAATTLLNLLYPESWTREPANPRYDLRPDLDQLQQEIRKLALFAHPNPIRRADVLEMVLSTTKDQLFPFLDALFAGQQDTAVQLLHQMLENGDDHFRVLAQIMQRIELGVPLGAAAGRSAETVAGDIAGSNARYLEVIRRASRAHSIESLLQASVQADRDQKQGRLRDAEDVIMAIIDATGTQKRSR